MDNMKIMSVQNSDTLGVIVVAGYPWDVPGGWGFEPVYHTVLATLSIYSRSGRQTGTELKKSIIIFYV